MDTRDPETVIIQSGCGHHQIVTPKVPFFLRGGSVCALQGSKDNYVRPTPSYFRLSSDNPHGVPEPNPAKAEKSSGQTNH